MNNRNQSEINALLQQSYTVNIGEFVGRGWELFKQNMGAFIGFFVLAFLGIIILAIIPILGSIALAVVSGPLLAGNFIVAFKIAKQQPVQFGDFFKGFQNSYFLPIFLQTLVLSAFTTLCYLPAMILFYIGIFISASTDQQPVILMAIAGALFLVGLAVIIYLTVSYLFAIPLIIGKRMQFWPAMETSRKLIQKQWFAFFGFGIVLGLIYTAGVLVCGVGVVFAGPLVFCAIAAAYEKIVGLPTFDPSRA